MIRASGINKNAFEARSTPNSPVGIARYHMSMSQPPSDATGGVAKTFDVQIPAKRKPTGVRFVYLNINTSASATYSAIRVGAAPTHLSALGTQITWWPKLLTAGTSPFPITFTAALVAATSGTLLVAWPGTTGSYNIVFSDSSVRTVTLTNASTAVSWTGAVTATASAVVNSFIVVPPAAIAEGTNHIIPGITVTDFVPLQPVARTDTPTGKYLYRVRSRSLAETQFVYSVSSLYSPAWNGYVGTEGPLLGSISVNTDYATSPPTDAVYTVLENGGFMNPIIALFSYEDPGTQIWAFSDSLFQGCGSHIGSSANNGALGWPTLIQIQQTNIDALNMGVAGQKTIDSVAVMKRMVSAVDTLPKYVALKVYSPNDGVPTQALIDVSWGYMLEACSWLKSKGITPILFTSPPVNTWTAGQHAFNEAQNARARALAVSCSWVKIVDMWQVIADPTNQRTILPAYLFTGDGASTHYLTAGHQAIADETVRVLNSL